MRNDYHRLDEIKSKASKKLSGFGNLEERLANEMFEISLLHEHEVPSTTWKKIIMMKEKCNTQKPLGNEGTFLASINEMSPIELEDLLKDIKYL